MKRKIPFFYTAFGLLAFAGLFLNDANGRKGSYAGAPGDIVGACTDCHSNRTHDVNGSLTLSGAPISFTSGVSYPLTLTLTDAQGIAGGFQIVATNSTAANNVMYGSFVAGTGTKIASTTGVSPNRLTHSTPKSFVGGKVSWTFNWVAPATGTGVKFYFAANASNFDNNESVGDAIYTNSQSGPIPVELITFDGKIEGKNVKLTWKTGSERNNCKFVIERNIANSADKFETIGEVKGSLTSSSINYYDYTDSAPFTNQITYYRLRQMDLDGTSTLSKVVSIGMNGLIKGFKIYPNFVERGNTLTLEKNDNESFLTIEVIDMTGRVVQTLKNVSYTEGAKISTSGLPTGRYFVRSVGNLLPLTQSFIVF